MIRTRTTKELEKTTFEKLGTLSLIIGPSKVLFKRYKLGIIYLGCFILGVVGGVLL